MKIRMYVSKDGEVLSNKEYPVRRPICLIPELEDRIEVAYFDAASELELADSRIRYKVYKAIAVSLPEDFLEPVDGLIS